LSAAARYVKPGGALVYATCTLLERENEDVVREFQAARPEYRVETSRTLYPHIDGTDGFYCCKLRRDT
jgi:16S rRNA (cytosine967-C5)-methyltransferase